MRLTGAHAEGCRCGSITPLAVLCASLLMAVVALVIDGGMLLEDRRHVQAAADAAALAAAADLFANYGSNQGSDPGGTAKSSALAIAAANGFANDGVQSTVTISISPQNYQSGANAGKPLPAGYVEVIIQDNASRLFSNIFGSGTLPVQGRAVAHGLWQPISDDVIALHLTASGAVTLSGGSSLYLRGSLRVNSNSSSALSVTGTGTVTASQYNLNVSMSSQLSWLNSILYGIGGASPTVHFTTPIADPLRSLPDPDPVALGLATQGTNVTVRKIQNLYPGVYTGGITVKSGGTAILHANSDGTPGIYYLQGGGFSAQGPSSIVMALGETAGIMLYNDWQASQDTISLSGSGVLTITPPASGPYKGISIFQRRGTFAAPAPVVSVSGQASANLTGTIYAAHAQVSLSSTGAANVLGGQIVADTLFLSGGAIININRGSQPVACARTLGLVE